LFVCHLWKVHISMKIPLLCRLCTALNGRLLGYPRYRFGSGSVRKEFNKPLGIQIYWPKNHSQYVFAINGNWKTISKAKKSKQKRQKKNKSTRSQCNIIKQTMSNQRRKVQFQAKAKISRKKIKVSGAYGAKGPFNWDKAKIICEIANQRKDQWVGGRKWTGKILLNWHWNQSYITKEKCA